MSQHSPAVCDELIQQFDHPELHLLHVIAHLHFQLNPLQVCLLNTNTQIK